MNAVVQLSLALLLAAAVINGADPEAFGNFDADEDDAISKNEFLEALKPGGSYLNVVDFADKWFDLTNMTKPELEYMFYRFDSNLDRQLTLEDQDYAFNFFDVDQDGSIQQDELSDRILEIEQAAEDFAGIRATRSKQFFGLDQDKSNDLSYSEFATIPVLADKQGNNDGQLTKDEFLAKFDDGTPLSDCNAEYYWEYIDADNDQIFTTEETKILFDKADHDEDEKVTHDEYVRIYLHIHVAQRVAIDKGELKSCDIPGDEGIGVSVLPSLALTSLSIFAVFCAPF